MQVPQVKVGRSGAFKIARSISHQLVVSCVVGVATSRQASKARRLRTELRESNRAEQKQDSD